MRAFLAAAALALLLAAAPAAAPQAPPAQPANGVLLVARPEMRDPNFARTVVLVTQAEDGHTLGVVLNRPTHERHESQPLWFGGPVLPRSVVALFVADAPPPAAAFHVLENIYLSMHPLNVDALLAHPGVQYRLYAGFAAWMPGQLERELRQNAWYVLPAEDSMLFREEMDGLWEALVARAQEERT